MAKISLKTKTCSIYQLTLSMLYSLSLPVYMYNIDMNITRTYITYSVYMALFGLFLILIDNHDFILRRDIIFFTFLQSNYARISVLASTRGDPGRSEGCLFQMALDNLKKIRNSG